MYGQPKPVQSARHRDMLSCPFCFSPWAAFCSACSCACSFACEPFSHRYLHSCHICHRTMHVYSSNAQANTCPPQHRQQGTFCHVADDSLPCKRGSSTQPWGTSSKTLPITRGTDCLEPLVPHEATAALRLQCGRQRNEVFVLQLPLGAQRYERRHPGKHQLAQRGGTLCTGILSGTCTHIPRGAARRILAGGCQYAVPPVSQDSASACKLQTLPPFLMNTMYHLRVCRCHCRVAWHLHCFGGHQ